MMRYSLEWMDDLRSDESVLRGWLARFEDGVSVFVTERIKADPILLDRLLRDAHDDHLGDDAPMFRTYKVEDD